MTFVTTLNTIKRFIATMNCLKKSETQQNKLSQYVHWNYIFVKIFCNIIHKQISFSCVVKQYVHSSYPFEYMYIIYTTKFTLERLFVFMNWFIMFLETTFLKKKLFHKNSHLKFLLKLKFDMNSFFHELVNLWKCLIPQKQNLIFWV